MNNHRQAFSLDFKALGTEVSLEIISDATREKAARKSLLKAKEIYLKQEKLFSRFDRQSELSKLNESLGIWMPASLDLVDISHEAIKYHDQTDGFFDPRVLAVMEKIGYAEDFFSLSFPHTRKIDPLIPSGLFKHPLAEELKIRGQEIQFKTRMDFSGIAKGYITDKAKELFLSLGWADFIIDSGGDIYAAGKNLHDQPWVISVEGMEADQLLVSLSGQAVATSGIGRRKWEIEGKRFHHLVNPTNPNQFDFDLRSVSVVSKTVTEADVLAKFLFIKGKSAGLDWANANNIQAIFLGYSGVVAISTPFKLRLDH